MGNLWWCDLYFSVYGGTLLSRGVMVKTAGSKEWWLSAGLSVYISSGLHLNTMKRPCLLFCAADCNKSIVSAPERLAILPSAEWSWPLEASYQVIMSHAKFNVNKPVCSQLQFWAGKLSLRGNTATFHWSPYCFLPNPNVKHETPKTKKGLIVHWWLESSLLASFTKF